MTIWAPVIGYEGLYEASDDGRIRSLKRTSTSGKILKQHRSKRNGYCYVSMSKDNVAKTVRVHVAVLRAFHPEGKAAGLTVNHKDGNKANNRLDNLE